MPSLVNVCLKQSTGPAKRAGRSRGWLCSRTLTRSKGCCSNHRSKSRGQQHRQQHHNNAMKSSPRTPSRPSLLPANQPVSACAWLREACCLLPDTIAHSRRHRGCPSTLGGQPRERPSRRLTERCGSTRTVAVIPARETLLCWSKASLASHLPLEVCSTYTSSCRLDTVPPSICKCRECADLMYASLPPLSSCLSLSLPLMRPSSSLFQPPSLQTMQRPILLMPCCRSTTHSFVPRAHTAPWRRAAAAARRSASAGCLSAPGRAEQDGASSIEQTAQTRLETCRWRAKTTHTGLQRAGRVGVDPCSMLFCALGGVIRDCLRKQAGPYRYLTSSQLPHCALLLEGAVTVAHDRRLADVPRA